MSDVGMKIFPRGRGWHNTGATIAAADYGGVKYEGRVCVWAKDTSTAATYGGVRSQRGAEDVVTLIVRNVATVVLKPGRLVSWKAGYRGKRVDGYTCTTGAEVAGVVDDLFPAAGVPIGELFHLVVKGPCLVKTSTTASSAACEFSAGSVLIAETADASTNSTSGGHPVGADSSWTAAATGATMALQLYNAIGRAMSAITSAQTNTDCLVNLKLF